MPERDVDGRRPTARFRDAIFAGPVRGLEQWGALTADDWATAGAMMDQNPRLHVQHVIGHFLRSRIPPPVEPAAVADPPPVPVSTPKRTLELPCPTPKRTRTLEAREHELAAEVQGLAAEIRRLAVQAQEQLLALSLPVPASPVEPVPELAVAPEPVPELAVAPEPVPEPAVEAPLVPGPLPETHVLTPLPLWEARHNVPESVWASKVTEIVEAHGPFSNRIVIIVSIRYSRGRDLVKEQYDLCVERCVEAASTLIRHIRSLGGQADRPFLIYPWIRSDIGSSSDWFRENFSLRKFPRGIPRTTKATCRLKELEFILDNVQPDTNVWWLSIGIDALTTDIENLRRAQTRWRALDFTMAVMVHASFLPDVWQFGDEDICPPRPAASGMRIRIYSFARLLTGAHNLGDAPASKLLAVWQYINDAKRNKTPYDKSLAMYRNTMSVSSPGLGVRGQPSDRV